MADKSDEEIQIMEGFTSTNDSDNRPVPFLRNFHWGGKTGKKGRTKNMSRRGLANTRV